MHDGSILVAGVGGLGCLWARRAHDNCSDYAGLLLVDGDPLSNIDLLHHQGAHLAVIMKDGNLHKCTL